MKVFLTGGTGFIGQRLVPALIRHGAQVTALVRRPNSLEAKRIEGFGAVLVQGDVTNKESMRLGMQGADVVIHNAGVYELGLDAAGIERMNAVNIRGTENTLGLALELGVPRSVYLSTTWAYGASSHESPRDETFPQTESFRTHYERTKKAAHRTALDLQKRGLPLIILCPNAVVGANDHSSFGYTLRMYLCNLLPPIAWTPEVKLSLVHVDDLCQGVVRAAQQAKLGETYFLGGQAHTRADMFKFWCNHAGGSKTRAWLPVNLLKAVFYPLEPLQRAIGLPAVFSRELVEAGRISLFDSSQKAVTDFAWTHRSAKAMWDDTIEEEKALLAARVKRDIVSLLNPLHS